MLQNSDLVSCGTLYGASANPHSDLSNPTHPLPYSMHRACRTESTDRRNFNRPQWPTPWHTASIGPTPPSASTTSSWTSRPRAAKALAACPARGASAPLRARSSSLARGAMLKSCAACASDNIVASVTVACLRGLSASGDSHSAWAGPLMRARAPEGGGRRRCRRSRHSRHRRLACSLAQSVTKTGR